MTDLLAHFRWARTFLAAALRDIGFRVYVPDGAYFIMADWTQVPAAAEYPDDTAFCKGLTQTAGVAAIPPSAFYEHRDHGRPLARFAFCKKRETLEEAVRRLCLWAGRPHGAASD